MMSRNTTINSTHNGRYETPALSSTQATHIEEFSSRTALDALATPGTNGNGFYNGANGELIAYD
jgi:hypothetical protein